jgi:hypothetical protein
MERKELIKNILEYEWEMFTGTQNAGGRASCQDDKKTFLIMRNAQAEIWSTFTLVSYLNDLKMSSQEQINLMTIKYARMMEITFPGEYEKIKDRLPAVSQRKVELADEIMMHHSRWALEASGKYPGLFSLGRPVASGSGRKYTASMDNYLRSELLTYTEATLELCLKDTVTAEKENKNLAMEILKNTAKYYGYDSLDEIENVLNKKNK